MKLYNVDPKACVLGLLTQWDKIKTITISKNYWTKSVQNKPWVTKYNRRLNILTYWCSGKHHSSSFTGSILSLDSNRYLLFTSRCVKK